MSEVKRYYIMESAVGPMRDEQLTYTPLVNYKTDAHVVPLVLASDYDALAAECERLRREAKNDAIAYKAAIERQNEIRTERDAALAELAKVAAQRDAILQQARAWSCEAKTQRATVLEVGDILGGVPDWGPIAAGVEAMRAELAALKGGQEAATNRKTWSPAANGFSCLHCGTARAYHDMQTFCPTGPAFASGSSSAKPVAPPAQASAWVAEITPAMIEAGANEVIAPISTAGRKAEAVFRAMLAAAPTPGASDGKGGDHSAHDLNMVQVPKDLHLITLGMLSSYVTTLAEIDFPDNDEGDYQQRLNENKRAAVNSTIAKLRALIVSAGKAGEP